MVKEPLQEWVYACMHKHSVGAEWQVGNQQVISTDSVPFPSQRHVRLDKICATSNVALGKNIAQDLQSSLYIHSQSAITKEFSTLQFG